MAIDPKMTEAIEDAVSESGQPTSLATSIVAWVSAITSGKEDPHDPTMAARRADVLYSEALPTIEIEGLT